MFELLNMNTGKVIDSRIAFLSHFDGVVDSSTIVDELGQSITSIDATISNSIVKFGSGSLDLNVPNSNSQKYIKVANTGIISLGTRDFTIECFGFLTQYIDSAHVHSCIFRTPGVRSLMLGVNQTGRLRLYGYSSTTAGGVIIIGNQVVPLNEFVHIALSRISGVLYLHVNGKFDVQIENTTDLSAAGGDLVIGGFDSPGQTANYRPWFGNIDEFRILNGIGLYGPNDITIPSAPFRLDQV